ncbi:acyl-CoA dehydrogenase family protein [Streptomyces hiroshimensis]|uniref:Acyl-CoA dehydrogenase n=1 Tax=Streptomyces hiroshimensis TaxID=66424 RepID=A0ABQ2YT76_9ACTN|nr:acyl-CoA dehydrogenase family protein [Streptomyces hiroshimensis]GGX91740.1 acyl-CoA dehydrogenase [Streptomyces hiroshimensis]
MTRSSDQAEAATATATATATTLRGRVAALERHLGDPRDPGNPLGHTAVLAADRRGELPLGGDRLLDAFGLREEIVPQPLGGRLTGLDTATQLLRAVFRRDFALGRGHGSASLVSAAFAWCHGTPAQQARTARLLLDGGRLSVAFQNMSYGNEFSSGDLTLTPAPQGGWVLDGRTPLIANAPLAAGFVLLARHADGAGGGDSYGGSNGTGTGNSDGTHSALLLNRADLPPDAVRPVSPYRTGAVRRLPAGFLEFDRWPVPEGSVLGAPGDGTAVALRSLQVSRPLVPSMAVGCADTALRSVVEAVLERAPGVRPLTSRYARRAITSSFADMLVCDCLLLAAIRSLHLLPEESSVWTAAAMCLVVRMLQQSTGDLAAVLGPRALQEEGGFGTFRKHLRDLSEIPPGPIGAAAALATLVPQLPFLARTSWTAAPPPDGLFSASAPLPPLDPARLDLAAGGDTLMAVLPHAEETLDALPVTGPDGEALRSQVGALAAELRALGEECRALPAQDLAALATPHGYALAERYTLLAAAAACLGVWMYGDRGRDREEQGEEESGFLSDPAWLIAALGRVQFRLGLPEPAADGRRVEALLAEAVARCAQGRSLDLYDVLLGGGPATA